MYFLLWTTALVGLGTLAHLYDAKECGIRPDLNLGIYYGELARKAEFPWQISLQRLNRHMCGGSIISDNWIITAAHCVFYEDGEPIEKESLSVLIGALNSTLPRSQIRMGAESERRLIAIKNIVAHPDFQDAGSGNDIALLELSEPIGIDQAGDNVNAICLGRDADISGGNDVVISGWGQIETKEYPDILRKATVQVVDIDQCKDVMKETHSEIFDCQVCATSKPDTCYGDSGGPLQYSDKDGRWYLLGLTSWGFECGAGLYPAVYTRVPYFLDFIREVTKIESL